MSRISSILLLLFVAFSFSGCIKYEQVELKEISDFEVKNMNKNGIELLLTAQISNPNAYKIKVTDYDLELIVNGTSLGKPVITEMLVLPKKSDQKHTLSVTADMSAILSGGFGAMMKLLASSKIDFQVKGTIKAKAMGLKKGIKVDESYTYSM